MESEQITIRDRDIDCQITIGSVETKYSNDGWIKTCVTIHSPGFSGVVPLSIECKELNQFVEELEKLNKDLKPGDTAQLKPLEGGANIKLILKERGNIKVGARIDSPDKKYSLRIKLESDQSDLSKIIRQSRKFAAAGTSESSIS